MMFTTSPAGAIAMITNRAKAIKMFAPAARSDVSHLRILLGGLLLLLASTQAFAELMLYPTRIVFDANERAAKLELINNGTETETYRLSLVNLRMSETGGFSEIEQPLPNERFAKDLLRFSPRQVQLEPGAGQTVRIMVRKPANLAAGEYRSHLFFAQQPEPDANSSVEMRDTAAGDGIGIRITTLVSVSIPIIVRHGSTQASVSLTHLDLRQRSSGSSVLAFHMERSGNQSLYGDLTVSFTPKRGSEQVIGRANGVAVYTPNLLRRASIVLEPPEDLQLANGTLRLTYREQAENGGDLLSEATLQLP